MKGKTIGVSLVVLLSLVIAMPAFADATVTISGGSLSVTPQSIGFGTVTLAGADQTVTDGDSTNWSAVDPTGAGAGWNVTIAATDFVDGGNTIAVANFDARLLDANISTVAGNTAPTSSITTYTALSTTAQTLLSAAVGDGMGSYTFVPDFTLDVAASTFAGTYTSTVTVAIVSGP
jgi:hypothetical protein